MHGQAHSVTHLLSSALPDAIHDLIPLNQTDPFAHVLQRLSDIMMLGLTLVVVLSLFFTFKFNIGPVIDRYDLLLQRLSRCFCS